MNRRRLLTGLTAGIAITVLGTQAISAASDSGPQIPIFSFTPDQMAARQPAATVALTEIASTLPELDPNGISLHADATQLGEYRVELALDKQQVCVNVATSPASRGSACTITTGTFLEARFADDPNGTSSLQVLLLSDQIQATSTSAACDLAPLAEIESAHLTLWGCLADPLVTIELLLQQQQQQDGPPTHVAIAGLIAATG